MNQSPYLGMRAVAWALLTMMLPLAAAQAQTFPTAPVNLSGTSHAEAPAIAIGPSGDISVVWFDAGAILFRRSPAGGGSFSSTMFVTTTNLPSQASQPQIAINAAGVYVAWAGINNSGGGDIFLSSLANNANIWTPPLNVSNGKGIASGSSAPVPRIATDPSGGVDIVWGQNGAWFRRSPDGISFSPPVPLTSATMAKQSPRMAINSQGHVFVVWENAASCPTITFARSTDKGAHFTPYSVDDTLTVNQQQETGCASDVQIAVGAGNSIWLLWANDSPIQDLIITYAIDQDPFTQSPTSTSFPEAEFENLSGTASHSPQMAIDASGDIDVVWIGDVRLNDAREVVYFSRSTDPEKPGTFCGGPNNSACPSPPVLTSPPQPQSNILATGFPQIAAEPSGAIDVLWQQASAANPNNAYDVVIAQSTDGVTFKQFKLDNSPTTTGNTGQVAVDGSGAVYAVWSGNSGSSADIFLSGDSAALTQFVVSGLTASISPASATISVGGSATFTVSLSSTNGSSGSVTLTCAGAPSGVSCSSGSVTVPGTGSLSVSVSAKPSASATLRWPAVPAFPSASRRLTMALWAIGVVMLVAALIKSKLKVTGTWTQLSHGSAAIGLSHKAGAFARPLALMLLLTAVATGLVSCSGSTNSGGGGGGGGGGGSITFPVTVQARSSSASANLQTISITVP